MHARASYMPVWSAERSARVPVLLVHGFGVSSAYWVPLAERLTRDFSVFAPDLPGHGKTCKPVESLDVPALADVLAAWMDEARIKRASVVGNSMGCQIAAELAVRYPALVDRLVFIGPTVDPSARRSFEQVRRLIASAAYEDGSLDMLVLKDYTRMGRRLRTEFRYMLRHHIDELLPRIEVPTLIVRGEKDRIAPQEWAEEAARLLPQGRLAVVPGFGHAVHFSGVDRLIPLVKPFLDGAVAK